MTPPKEMESTVYYNRGVLQAALHVEAVRNAIKAKGGEMPTGEDVKKGFETIKGFTLGGLVPPLEITAADHEGGGWVQICPGEGRQVREGDGVVPGLSGNHHADRPDRPVDTCRCVRRLRRAPRPSEVRDVDVEQYRSRL